MDNTKLGFPKKLLNLKEASLKLGVSIETLIKWNELNILKPTITLEGTIGYSEDQITHFLDIKQIVQISKPNSENQKPNLEIENQNLPQNDRSLTANASIESDIFASSPQFNNSDLNKSISSLYQSGFIFFKITRSPFLSLGLSITIIASVLAFTILTHNESKKTQFSLSTEKNSSKVLDSQITNFNIPTVTSMPYQVKQKNDSKISYTLNSEGENVLKERIKAPDILFSRSQASKSSQVAYGDKPSKGEILAAVLKNGIGLEEVTHDDLSSTTYASSGTKSKSDNLIFDEGGKIKGEAIDTLSTSLGGIGVITNSIPKQINSGPINIITFFAFSAITLFYLYPKRLAFIGKNSHIEQYKRDDQTNLSLKKIIEVDQKTDGTIVLLFHGKEYKVSKPELYSESDQFIERLMVLVKPGFKEIEYVSSADENIDTKTPLSRLVTRLGFVGVKRDLFFPRTSKDRVLFRKYLTLQDLKDMNLTTNQILTDLSVAS